MPLQFLSNIITNASDHTIPSPTFLDSTLLVGFVPSSGLLTLPTGSVPLPVDARSKVSALVHPSLGSFYYVDCISHLGRDFFVVDPQGNIKLIYTTKFKDRYILRQTYISSDNKPCVIFSVVGESGGATLYVYDSDTLQSVTTSTPTTSTNGSINTVFQGDISDLKVISNRALFTVRAPGKAAATIYSVDLDTLVTSVFFTSDSFGVIESIAPVLVEDDLYCFCMSLSKRSDGVLSFISKELFLVVSSSSGSPYIIEVSTAGMEYSRNLHAFYNNGSLHLCYLNDNTSKTLYWLRSNSFLSTTPQWNMSYLKPKGQDVLGFCFEGYQGVVMLEGSTSSELYYLQLPLEDTSSIYILSPWSIPRLTELSISSIGDNPEGLNTFITWSSDFQGVQFLEDTSKTSMIIGIEAPQTFTLTTTRQRGFLTPIATATKLIQVDAYQGPYFTETHWDKYLNFNWHELKQLTLQVVHDPLYPPVLNVTTTGGLSVGESEPLVGDTTYNPSPRIISDTITEFTFTLRSWHPTANRVESALKLKLYDILTDTLRQPVFFPCNFQPFPMEILGLKYITRSQYQGSLKSGNMGLGFDIGKKLSFKSDFFKAFKAFTSLGSATVLSGTHASLLILDWSSANCVYLVSYDNILDTTFLESIDTLITLTNEQLSYFTLSSSNFISHTWNGITSFTFCDEPTKTTPVSKLISSTPKGLVSHSSGCILLGDKDLSVIDNNNATNLSVTKLGYSDHILLKAVGQNLTPSTGLLCLLLSKDSSKVCVLYSMDSKSIIRVIKDPSDIETIALLKSSV